VLSLLALLAVLFGLTVLARHVFFATGDFLPEAEIVRMQRASDRPCLYSEYGKQNEAMYKFELYRAAKPDIIAIGSSRVLEMKQRQFVRPFINLGRVMTDIKRGDSAVEELLKIHKPKFMLIGLDHYWFNPNWREAGVDKVKLIQSDPNDPRAILRLLTAVVKRSLWSHAWRAIWHGPECHLGITAKGNLSGHAADGYRYYGDTITATTEPLDYKFADTLHRVAIGERRFERGDSVSDEQFRHLQTMHARLVREGVDHLFFFPTLAPAATAAMDKDGGYTYIRKLEERIVASGLPFANPHDPQLTDCDALDGFHLGDSGQVRQLNLLGKAAPRLGAYLDWPEVERLSQPGMMPIQYVVEDLGLKPRDFLGLGCAWAK
jgi:hypothetical protein